MKDWLIVENYEGWFYFAKIQKEDKLLFNHITNMTKC